MISISSSMNKGLRYISYLAVAIAVYALLTNELSNSNIGYYIIIGITVGSVLFEMVLNSKKRINIINQKLQIQSGNKIVKEFELTGDTRIIKGLAGVTFKSPRFEETLRYKDFDKNSVYILKGL